MQLETQMISIGEHALEVCEVGEGPLCVLVHGWPETWWSWRHQIPALVEAGYRVAAPNVRGYGSSYAPPQVEAYSMRALAGDLAALIEALGESEAVLIGHDWGAPIVWHTALLHPEWVRAVAGMSVPFLGRGGPVPPTQLYASIYAGRFFYMNYFQEPGVAEAEFEADIRDALAKVYFMNSGDAGSATRQQMRERKAGYLEGITLPEQMPDWLRAEDLDHYCASFERSGFRGSLNRYRNMDADWHELEVETSRPIAQPALFVAGEHDSVLRYAPGVNLLEMMEDFYADLQVKQLIAGAGHWVQQERPEAVNRCLVDWLGQL